MRTMLKLSIAFFLAFVAAPTPAFAERSAKRLLFHDCTAAREALKAMPEKEVEEFISYLGRVLSLPLGSTAEILHEPELSSLIPPTPMQRVGQLPLEDLKGGGISRTLEPGRESEAKACAAQLLLGLGDRGLEMIPVLVQVLNDPAATDEQRTSIRKNIETMIREAIQRQSPKLSPLIPKVFDAAIHSTDAADVFVAFGEMAVPHLVQEIFAASDSRAGLADRLLQRVDPGLSKSLPLFRAEFDRANPKVRDRVFTIISGWKHVPVQFLAVIFRQFLEEGEHPMHSAAELLDRILQQAEAAEQQLILDTPLLDELLGLSWSRFALTSSGFTAALPFFDLAAAGHWAGLVQRAESAETYALHVVFRAMRSPDVRDRVAESLKQSGTVAKIALLPILAALMPDDRSVVLLCIDQLRSNDRILAYTAFTCLGSSPAHAAEKAKALLQLLKSPAMKRDPQTRYLWVLFTLDILGRLPETGTEKSFLPFALESVAWEPLPPAGELKLGSGLVHQRERNGWQKFLQANPDAGVTRFQKLLETDSAVTAKRIVDFLSGSELRDPKLKVFVAAALANAAKRFPGDTVLLNSISALISRWGAAVVAEKAAPSL